MYTNQVYGQAGSVGGGDTVMYDIKSERSERSIEPDALIFASAGHGNVGGGDPIR
jgi:hypothetical protein